MKKKRRNVQLTRLLKSSTVVTDGSLAPSSSDENCGKSMCTTRTAPPTTVPRKVTVTLTFVRVLRTTANVSVTAVVLRRPDIITGPSHRRRRRVGGTRV
jgi:hypothetical protein